MTVTRTTTFLLSILLLVAAGQRQGGTNQSGGPAASPKTPQITRKAEEACTMDLQAKVPATGSGAATPDPESISRQIERVRATADSLLDKAQGGPSLADRAAAVEKAAGALKLAAELDKTRKESAKLSQEIAKLEYENETAGRRGWSDRVKDYVTLLTPLISILALALTVWQFLRSESDRREAALDSQWQEAVKTVSASGALPPGAVAFQPFLRSKKYGDQAKEAALNLLITSSDFSFFTNLFGTAFAPVTRDNLDIVVRLDRALWARAAPVWTKSWDAGKGKNDRNKLQTEEEKATFDYVQNVFFPITSEVGSALKTSRPGRTEPPVDLSGTYFTSGKWQGINFNGVNLENAQLENTDLQDAELRGVNNFSGLDLPRTAWWKAKSINRPLLEYLKLRAPYRPEDPYGPHQARVTPAEYDAAIKELMAQLQ